LGSRLDGGKGNGRKEKERRWDERREERDIKRAKERGRKGTG